MARRYKVRPAGVSAERTPAALHQLNAELVLELAHDLGDGRLAQAAAKRGPLEIAGLVNGSEDIQVLKAHQSTISEGQDALRPSQRASKHSPGVSGAWR
jgi:hypothetical protein